MSFLNFIIERHLTELEPHFVKDSSGKYKIHFGLRGKGDRDLRKHAAAHAAMEMNKQIGDSTFDSIEQAKQAVEDIMSSQRGKPKEYYQEEAPANAVGSGENIAGINPPAGPAGLFSSKLKGVASGMSLIDVARHHRVNPKVLKKQLQLGIKTEMEHVDPNDPDSMKIATKIAMDHIYEDPRYYTKLRNMESKSKKKINEKQDIGNDTIFTRGKDRLGAYRTMMLATRKTVSNKPEDERI